MSAQNKKSNSSLNFRGFSHIQFDRNRGQKLPGAMSRTSYERIAKAMENPQGSHRKSGQLVRPVEPSDPAPRTERPEMRYVASLAEAKSRGFEKLGTGMYRSGHAIWDLRAAEDGQGYLLVRKHEEREVDLRGARKTASKRKALAPAIAAGARWLLTNPRAWMMVASAYPTLKEMWNKFQDGTASMEDAQSVVQQLGPQVIETFMGGAEKPTAAPLSPAERADELENAPGVLDPNTQQYIEQGLGMSASSNHLEWRTVGGDVYEGQVIEVDSNVGIVACSDGVQRAVELTDSEINRMSAAGVDGAYRRMAYDHECHCSSKPCTCQVEAFADGPPDEGPWERPSMEIAPGQGPVENHPDDAYGTDSELTEKRFEMDAKRQCIAAAINGRK